MIQKIDLIPEENLSIILPLMKQLNEETPMEILSARLNEMIGQGYKCVGVWNGNNDLIAACGIWITTRFYSGKFIEPDNVVVHRDYRGLGVGEKMMEWVYEYGRKKGCVFSELNAYVSNGKGHKFWFNEGFTVLGFHFRKTL